MDDLSLIVLQNNLLELDRKFQLNQVKYPTVVYWSYNHDLFYKEYYPLYKHNQNLSFVYFCLMQKG